MAHHRVGRHDRSQNLVGVRVCIEHLCEPAGVIQHVHGGIGIDTTYPLHRYSLWAKHNELTLGSATQQLVHLGSTYPEGQL